MKDNPQVVQTQNIKCLYGDQAFNITINQNENLLNLKQMIVDQMKTIKSILIKLSFTLFLL